MAIKFVSPKSVDWNKVSYLPYTATANTKVQARNVAKQYTKFYKDILIIPEISYATKRPYAYTVVGMGLLK